MAIPTLKSGWLMRESSILKRWKTNWFVLYRDGNLAFYKDESLQEREGNFNIPHTCSGIKTALECQVNPPENRNYGTLLKLESKSYEPLVVSASDSDEALGWRLMVEPYIAQQPQQQPVRTAAPPYGNPGVTQVTQQQPVRTAAPPYGNPGVTQVTQYTTYPNGTTAVRRVNNGTRRTYQYPVQQNVPVYYYPNHGPLQVQYDATDRPYYVHPHTQVITIVRDDDPYYYRTGDVMLGAAAGAMVGAAMFTPFLFF